MKKTSFSSQNEKIELILDEKRIGRIFIYYIQNELHDSPYALIEDLFIEEKFRSKGYGKQLLQQAIHAAKQNNCYKILLTSRFGRERLHDYYKKLGFEEHGKEFRMNL